MPPSPPTIQLPVRAVLPELVARLRVDGAAVLVAPPGTGKTTLTPLAVAEAVTGRVVVAEPRRVAARAAARRMAALLGQRVGETVGYAVRGDRRVGPRTRIEVVTTGLLVQRMQHDPELTGVAAVLLDECHERQLDADLALAFTVESRAVLRPDLWLVAMSATAHADRFAALLGTPERPAAVVTAEAVIHPVTTVWAPPPSGVTAPQGLRVDPALLDHVAATVRRALREHPGDLLVFLPGTGEIASVTARLADLPPEVDLVPLHGRQSATAQDRALRPQPDNERQRVRRVVLATAVAESSLTVPGVRIVVDAGLSRVARTDLGRGLGTLVTVPVSRAGATQRAGRAGREAPGVVYRCWSEATHDHLSQQPEPEIATADLTTFVLHLACWGDPDGSGLALPDPVPTAASTVARQTLTALGALDDTGRVTARGRTLLGVGAHPRLARALLDGAAVVGPDRAAEIVAVLAEEIHTGGDDLVGLWRGLRTGRDPTATARWRTEVRRLHAALPPTRPNMAPPNTPGRIPDDLAAGLLVGLAYPERLARVRQPGGSTYLMAGGTAAQLDPRSALAGAQWLAVAVAARAPGDRTARIRLAAALDEATAGEAGAHLVQTVETVTWSDGDVLAHRRRQLGAIVLAEERLPHRADLFGPALLTGLRQEGLDLLRWDTDDLTFRQRLAFCHHVYGDPWPEMTDEALLAAAPHWLAPELATARNRADLARTDVTGALRRLVPGHLARRLDTLAPERLGVPSGSRVRLDYTDPASPVLAVKLQETFGWSETPCLADGRVPVLLHLLSPAGRPVAVTRDLTSFWRVGYHQVRSELRGRYPRHPWPEDPTTAPPTRYTNRRH